MMWCIRADRRRLIHCHARPAPHPPGPVRRGHRPQEVADLKEAMLARGRVEDALRHAEEQLRTLTDSAPIRLCLLHADGTPVVANAPFARLLGYDSPAELQRIASTFGIFGGPAELVGSAVRCSPAPPPPCCSAARTGSVRRPRSWARGGPRPGSTPWRSAVTIPPHFPSCAPLGLISPTTRSRAYLPPGARMAFQSAGWARSRASRASPAAAPLPRPRRRHREPTRPWRRSRPPTPPPSSGFDSPRVPPRESSTTASPRGATGAISSARCRTR